MVCVERADSLTAPKHGFFTITAAERRSISMLQRLKKNYPDQVDIRHVNADGSIVAHIPSGWVKISPNRQLTPDERRRRSDRMKAMQDSRPHELITK